MECTICFEAIDERTGSATLSCGHIYHFGCLARWILKTQTCPYCRHETNAFETIQQDEEPESESESEYESTVISHEENHSLRWVRVGPGRWRTFPRLIPQIPEFSEEDHALWVFRSFFQQLEETDTLPNPVSEKLDEYKSYIDLLFRNKKTFNVAHERGYESG
jgi:hypothetical protein